MKPSALRARRWLPRQRRRRSGNPRGGAASQPPDRDAPGEEPFLNRRPVLGVVALPAADRFRFDRDRVAMSPHRPDDDLFEIARAGFEFAEQALGRFFHRPKPSLTVLSMTRGYEIGR